MKMKKKGNAVIEGAFIIAMLFSIVLTVMILSKTVIQPINADIQSDPDFSAQAKQISGNSSLNFSRSWDNFVPFLLVVFYMAAVITSLYIDTKPAFFIFSVIGMIVVLIVAMSIEQSYEDTIQDDDFSGFELEFPKINFIMENIVFVILIIMFSVAVALYSKGS